MNRLLMLLWMVALMPATLVAADAPVRTDAQAFAAAAKLYSEGNYTGAAAGYRSLIAEHPASAILHANLARAAYRDKMLAEAILEMRRAALLSPRDPDIKSDLTLMRDSTSDRIVPQLAMNPLRLASALGHSVSEREAWKLLIASAFFFFTLLSLRLYHNRAWVGWGALACGLALALTATALLGKLLGTPDFGVVKAEETLVRSGTATTDTVLFKLHEGAEFDILKTLSEGWLKIELADGKVGWVESKDVVY